jgi:hypothetical protein
LKLKKLVFYFPPIIIFKKKICQKENLLYFFKKGLVLDVGHQRTVCKSIYEGHSIHEYHSYVAGEEIENYFLNRYSDLYMNSRDYKELNSFIALNYEDEIKKYKLPDDNTIFDNFNSGEGLFSPYESFEIEEKGVHEIAYDLINLKTSGIDIR